jgi:hypothetical protein
MDFQGCEQAANIERTSSPDRRGRSCEELVSINQLVRNARLTSMGQRSKANEQILNATQGLSEAQERNQGDSSKFWKTYDNISKEYDDALLSRGNGDMNIILTFVRSLRSTPAYANLTVEQGWFILGRQLYLHHRNAA